MYFSFICLGDTCTWKQVAARLPHTCQWCMARRQFQANTKKNSYKNIPTAIKFVNRYEETYASGHALTRSIAMDNKKNKEHHSHNIVSKTQTSVCWARTIDYESKLSQNEVFLPPHSEKSKAKYFLLLSNLEEFKKLIFDATTIVHDKTVIIRVITRTTKFNV